MKIVNLLSLLLLVLSLQSCFKNDPLDVPAYIYIDNISLSVPDPENQGTASENIVDAWVSVDAQLIGVKDFPVLLPVMYNDSLTTHEIRVGAGILENGVSTSHVMYPFYIRYTENRVLEPGKIDTLFPVVEYDPSCVIRLVDNFEGAGTNFGYNVDQDTATMVILSDVAPFEGLYSGKFQFSPTSAVLQVATGKYSNLQSASTSFPVYVEMNYKTDVPVEVGLISFVNGIQSQVSYIGGVNPSAQWKKIYFNFTTQVFQMNAQEYALAFRAFKSDSIPNPQVYIDNVKLLHY